MQLRKGRTMKSSIFTLTFMCSLAASSYGCRSSDADSGLNGSALNCVNFGSSYSAVSQIATLTLTNNCGRSLDFSEARLQFFGTQPQSQPWGNNPAYFSWINWTKQEDGFYYKKDPGATWVRVELHNGDSLVLNFNASGQPQNPSLYLGGAQPEPKPQPKPEPGPEPKPEPTPNPPYPAPMPTGKREIVAYYQSWSGSWASEGKNHSLANLPPYITTVLLSFVRPEASYRSGQNSWVGTGMDFSADFHVVRDAIRSLKHKNPGTKVLLSIGGATYVNWRQANAGAIAALVRDLGADGADLDYEPTEGVCSWGTGGNSCPGDQEFISLIRQFRAALPRPYLLTTAAWSTGAFGPGQYAASRFAGNLVGANFGLYVNPLKEVGQDFDAVYIMSYDAGGPAAPAGNATGYDPKLAFDAYRAIYQGPLMLGVEVPPEAWGGHVSTPQEAQDRAQYVIDHGGNGMMIWSIQKSGHPSASAFVQAMCTTLQLPRCDLSLGSY